MKESTAELRNSGNASPRAGGQVEDPLHQVAQDSTLKLRTAHAFILRRGRVTGHEYIASAG